MRLSLNQNEHVWIQKLQHRERQTRPISFHRFYRHVRVHDNVSLSVHRPLRDNLCSFHLKATLERELRLPQLIPVKEFTVFLGKLHHDRSKVYHCNLSSDFLGEL